MMDITEINSILEEVYMFISVGSGKDWMDAHTNSVFTNRNL